MKAPSLSVRLERFFSARPNDWISGKLIEQIAIEKGLKGSTASRRLREAESGIGSNGKPCKKFLERRETRKGYVEYKYIPSEKIVSRYVNVDGVMREIKEKIYA